MGLGLESGSGLGLGLERVGDRKPVHALEQQHELAQPRANVPLVRVRVKVRVRVGVRIRVGVGLRAGG